MTTDIHQFLFGEIGVARQLVAGITLRILLEKHQRLLAPIDEGHPTARREMISLIAQHGLYQTVGVPHALARITSIIGIDGLDGVLLGVREVDEHILWQVVHHITHITGRHDQIDVLRQFVVEHGRLLRGGTHIIATETVATLETARLDIHRLHLLTEEFDATQVRVLVGTRLKEL